MLYFSPPLLIDPLDDGYPRATVAPVGILPLLEPQWVLENVPADRIHYQEDSNE
jgi:hypothetical protein